MRLDAKEVNFVEVLEEQRGLTRRQGEGKLSMKCSGGRGGVSGLKLPWLRVPDLGVYGKR